MSAWPHIVRAAQDRKCAADSRALPPTERAESVCRRLIMLIRDLGEARCSRTEAWKRIRLQIYTDRSIIQR